MTHEYDAETTAAYFRNDAQLYGQYQDLGPSPLGSHPAREDLGACPACGLIFSTSAPPARLPIADRHGPTLSGLGGWLTWFGIGITATPIVLAATFCSEIWSGLLEGLAKNGMTWKVLTALSPGTLVEMLRAAFPDLGAAVVLYGAFVAWSVRISALYYRRRRKFPTEWKWFQVVWLGANLLELELTRLSGEPVTDQDFGDLARIAAFGLIVWLYIARSQRVRNTFVS